MLDQFPFLFWEMETFRGLKNDDNVDFQGCVCSAIAFVIMSWAIHKKGPLYVSVFSPLLLVIVAISSWALLGEKLYVGT